MARKIKLIKHISNEELLKLYEKEKNVETKERLLAIKLYYEGHNSGEIEKILNKEGSTLRKWKKKWNENGYDGLKVKRSGGRKPKLLRL